MGNWARPVFAFLFLASELAAQGQNQPLTLREAVTLALQNHPSIRAVQQDVDAAQALARQAAATRWPQLQVKAGYQRSDNPVFAFSSLLLQRRFSADHLAVERLNRPGAFQNFNEGLAAHYRLYDGGERSSQQRAAAEQIESAKNQLQATQIDLIRRTAEAYFAVQLAHQELAVADMAVKAAEADLEKARTRLQAGMTVSADVLAIQVHLANQRKQQTAARFRLQLAKASLNELLGAELDSEVLLATPLDHLERQLQAELPQLSDLEASALSHSPRLAMQQALVKATEQQLQAARSRYLPRIDLMAGIESNTFTLLSGGSGNWTVGGTLQWELFNGFRDREAVRQTQAQLRSQQHRLEALTRHILLEVRQAYYDFQTARQSLAVSSEAVKAAEETVRIVRDRYEAGLTDVTELLRSQLSLTEARLGQAKATYDLLVAYVRLEAAVGTLSPNSRIFQ